MKLLDKLKPTRNKKTMQNIWLQCLMDRQIGIHLLSMNM